MNTLVFSLKFLEVGDLFWKSRPLENWDHHSRVPRVNVAPVYTFKRGGYFIVGEKLEAVREVANDLLHLKVFFKYNIGVTLLVQVVGFQSMMEVMWDCQAGASNNSGTDI